MRRPIVPQRIENEYSRKLRKVAGIVGTIIEHHTIIEKGEDGLITRVLLSVGLNEALRNYSGSITPWAKTVASLMLKDVDRANAKYFLSVASQMSDKLKDDQLNSAIGMVARKLHEDQVTLITSLPIEAGQRAQTLAQEAAVGGRRASEVADMIMASGDVTKARANTIARTEIHKSYATFTQSRATYVGANQYIWRTAGDEIVRESHAEMDGVVCDFNNPPEIDGESYNAGQTYNCRCFAEPIIGDE